MKGFLRSLLMVIICCLLWIIMILHWELGGETSTVSIIEKGTNVDSTREEIERKCININTADLEELTMLPGVGKVIATRIMEYRKTKGKFYKLSDLDKVKGIGPAKLKKIRNYICF
ncbi:MAG: ComEA family DNA-binding protein [Chitinispirillaceae bacterium]|nr:ComEA family DNA-binding protein [Chitinispirillaceae bacterium]